MACGWVGLSRGFCCENALVSARHLVAGGGKGPSVMRGLDF